MSIFLASSATSGPPISSRNVSVYKIGVLPMVPSLFFFSPPREQLSPSVMIGVRYLLWVFLVQSLLPQIQCQDVILETPTNPTHPLWLLRVISPHVCCSKRFFWSDSKQSQDSSHRFFHPFSAILFSARHSPQISLPPSPSFSPSATAYP